jgi:uncharacterized coiled-coil protein SlyX
MNNRTDEEWRRDILNGLTAHINAQIRQFDQRIKNLEEQNTKIQTQVTELNAIVARMENQYASYDTHIKYLSGALAVTFSILIGFIWLSVPHINW